MRRRYRRTDPLEPRWRRIPVYHDFDAGGRGAAAILMVSPLFLLLLISTNQEGSAELDSQIAYSQMQSGKWSIIIQADNLNFQAVREFQLTVQNLEKLTVTATPTVVVGVTSTEPAVSMYPFSLSSLPFPFFTLPFPLCPFFYLLPFLPLPPGHAN